MPIAYVKHPVTKDEVKALSMDGFRIVDIKFKPAKIEKGDKVVDKKPTTKPKPKK